jgi:hypothetical protein
VKELAEVAIKIFSVKPSSLAEERFGSVMDWLMTSRRGCLAPATLVQLMRVRSFILHTRSGRAQAKTFPINLKEIEEKVLPSLREQVERHDGLGAGDRLVPPIHDLPNPDSTVTYAADVADLDHPTLHRIAAEMVEADEAEFGIPDRLRHGVPTASEAASAVAMPRRAPIDPRTIDFASFTLPSV